MGIRALPGIRGEARLGNEEGCQSGIHCKPRDCPAGFSCPGGNSSAVPCPPGMFGPGGAALPSCLPCPAGFFSPRPGQKSCLPCGSEAEQPAEGRHTCVCPGKGRVFQPRDALCICPPGFRKSGRDGKSCSRRSYPVCRDSSSRNQEGQCLSSRGWARYCSQKVCAVPRDFQGYDKTLGLCVCRSDSLEGVCDSRCRRRQKATLQLGCAGGRAQLLVTHSNGSKTAVLLEGLRKVVPRPNFSLEDACAAGQQSHPAHLVEMSGKGFLGVYNPDPQLVQDLMVLAEASPPHKRRSPAAPDPRGPEDCREQILSPPNSTSQPRFLGILNPTACSSGSLSLVFLLSREHFPIYDVNNLYNTNAEFDWGDFRSLREEIREIPRDSQEFLLFLFHFHTPGTYVLRLSSNRHKRMYLRVMPAGTQCYEEGPFFPSTPRFAVQVGIGRTRELQLSPDWAAMAGLTSGLLLLLAACLALAFLCQGLGWAHRSSPRFRRQQLSYSLDGYSSKIPAVFAVEKTHPGLQHEAGHSCSAAGTGSFPRRGNAWEPEGQIDLESFNTKVFYELLLRQSQAVTSTLGHFQEEVKAVYHRVMNEISSLKNLWIKALSIPGKGEEDGELKQQVPFPENPQAPRVSGLSGASKNPWESIPHKLIPLLQTVLQVLGENRKNHFSPESPAAGAAAEEGELAPVDPAALSPREFVLFQYGLSILQFLTFHIKAPEISLAVASSLPQSHAPGNAFRNSFFYQNSTKKLFILRDCLGSGGGFLLVLVHCLAHVTAGDLSHDSNPLFLSLFYQALKACLSEMFSLRLQLPAAAQGINQVLLKEEPLSTEDMDLISQLLEGRVKNLTDMEALEKNLLLRVKSEESLSNNWLVKKNENFLHPQSSSGRDSLGQRAHLEEETLNPLSPSELEERVDALTQELVQIIEDEEQFLSSKGNEDVLSYYLEITSLEKESLLKQINALEEEMAQGTKL